MPVYRDSLPEEERHYLLAVKNRDEEMYHQVFVRYPGVFWGNVYSTLSKDDKEWINGIHCQTNNDDHDD